MIANTAAVATLDTYDAELLCDLLTREHSRLGEIGAALSGVDRQRLHSRQRQVAQLFDVFKGTKPGDKLTLFGMHVPTPAQERGATE
jgi:hypothetical protein